MNVCGGVVLLTVFIPGTFRMTNRDTPGSEGDPVCEDQWEARKFHLLWAYDLPFFGAPNDETQLRSVMKCYELLYIMGENENRTIANAYNT